MRKDWIDFQSLKEKVEIETLLEKLGLLKKLEKKKDEFFGPCPFCESKYKSPFRINLLKKVYKCFSCGEGGDILSFLSKYRKETLRISAIWLKGVLEEKEEEKGNKPLTFQLKNLDSNHPYLTEKRGLTLETIKHFGLGYYSLKGIMKERVVIPIHNEKDELIAYTGRVIDDTEPKYLFPQGFKKRLVLFNLNRLKDTDPNQPVILVEGFFSVFNLWQLGFKRVLALMGVEMSEQQEKLLVDTLGRQGRVILLLDGDEVGKRCTNEVINRLCPQLFVKAIFLKDDFQPDFLLKEEVKRLFE